MRDPEDEVSGEEWRESFGPDTPAAERTPESDAAHEREVERGVKARALSPKTVSTRIN